MLGLIVDTVVHEMPQDRRVSDTDVFHCAKDYSRALARPEMEQTTELRPFRYPSSCGVSPQSPKVETTTTPRNHLRYLT